MSRDQLKAGFVLHRRDYGDTSLLVEVLSASDGRLPLVAKGARRAKRGGSSQAALLQPFVPLLLAWSGRGEVKTLTRVEAAGPTPAMVGDALYCGFYVNEILVRLTERQDVDPVIVGAYQGTIEALAGGASADTVLRRFELRLLGQLGYRPPLDRDADTGVPVSPEQHYLFDLERGPILAEQPDLADALSGETLLALDSGDDIPAHRAREARNLLRRLLAPHLGERPLMSRALFAGRRGG
jgi:DNA repair protein RecO (recombination protein O)